MIEKIGKITNPLTVIAMFAAITEVTGTLVLPFVSEANQATLVWFIVAFPALLVSIFFITLNFNHRVLYAPSDYRADSSFLTASKITDSQLVPLAGVQPAETGISFGTVENEGN